MVMVGAVAQQAAVVASRQAVARQVVVVASRQVGEEVARPRSSPRQGQQARVILDDGEVSSDEDEPIQKRLRWLSGTAGLSGSRPAPAMPNAAAVANKEALDKRATEEAMVTRAAEEAAEKTAADKEATDKRTADEAIVKGAAVGAVGDSSAPG
jgi:hypothetical protein